MTDRRVPDFNNFTSPPRRPDLTYETVEDGELIGSGGQATVKRVSLPGPKPPDTVAVKQPQAPTETLDTAIIESFFQETETWDILAKRERTDQHRDTDHIVGIVATGENLPWLAMEYMDGGNLADRFDSNPNGLPVDEALWIAKCICRGLKLAHDNGVAHLDLKPENILFREAPGSTWAVPKIADWGLARTLIEESGSMEAFSVKYAAPEQFDSDQFGNPDIHTDIYQLGTIVYKMLTGHPPYTGDQASVMHNVVYGDDPAPPSTHRDVLPEALDEVVMRALSADKSQRYRGSVELFDEAIQNVQQRKTSTRIGTSCENKTIASDEYGQDRITLVGCGGAGGNTVNRIHEEGIQGVKLVVANTDAQHLVNIEADTKILLGEQKTEGQGASSVPQIGEEAAVETQEEIYDSIEGSDIVFVTAGLGGGTGTGASPVVANAARDSGALTISIVTTPLTAEGETRRSNAEAGLKRLRDVSDTVIVISNDQMYDSVGELSVRQYYKTIDEVLMRSVKRITELVTKPGLAKLDFADVRTVMENGGVAKIGLGESDSESKVQDSVKSALHSPSLDVDISAANSALVNIAGSSDLDMDEVNGVVKEIQNRINSDAQITWDASIKQNFKSKIEIMIVVWGDENV